MNEYLNSMEQRIAAIPTPAFDLAAVQAKAERKPLYPIRRRKIIASILLAVATPVVAVAAAHFVPLQVTHRFENWQLYGPDKGETLLHPTPAMFARLARKAPYHIVWPSGLPLEHKAFMLSSVGSEVFIVIYSCAGQRIDHASSSAIIIPKNHAAVNPNLGKWFTSQLQDHRNNVLWDVGSQSVLFGSDCLSKEQIEHVRAVTVAKNSTPPL